MSSGGQMPPIQTDLQSTSQGGRRATGHPTECHIHDTSDRDKVKCHMCAQIPGDILVAGVKTFGIIAAAHPLMYKSVSADMQPVQ